MNTNLYKAVKIIVPVATFGLGLVSSWLNNKELDEKITKKAAEAVANVLKEEA